MNQDLINTFKKRNINLVTVKTKKEARKKILEMIPKKVSIGCGGSVTLKEIGILEDLREGDYAFLDRQKVTPKTPEYVDLMKKAQHVDYFLSGTNAITEDGKIINIDGNGNRVSALIYGPEKVIIIVGKNKIVPDYKSAINRIKTVSCPTNAKRLNLDLPCAKLGKCVDCQSPQRMCCSTVTLTFQRDPNRITVILVDEKLGY